MRWHERVIHAVLNALFKRRDIAQGDDLYLRRWFIKRSGENRIFLHFIGRSDRDRDLHDHPWDFKSFIIAGGYTELLPDYKVRDAKPGMFLDNKAEHTHSVRLHARYGPKTATGRKLEEKPAWTLVFVKKARRTWGFHTKDGWVDWRTYLNAQSEPDSPEDV